MQLTAKFAVLAAALAYGSTSVLALPVGSAFFAREYDIEARDVPTEVSYFAREVPELALDARSFFDSEEFDAREVTSTPAVPTTPATPATPATPVTPVTPVTPAGGSSLHEAKHRALHEALADPAHPHHKAAVRHVRLQKALADPTDPLHHKALRVHKFRKALADPNHPDHERAHAIRAKHRALRAALKDPNHPNHEAALKHLEATKALRRQRHPHSLEEEGATGSPRHHRLGELNAEGGLRHQHSESLNAEGSLRPHRHPLADAATQQGPFGANAVPPAGSAPQVPSGL